MDDVLKEIAGKIAEISLSVEDDEAIPNGDVEWRKGYKQACSDIILMVCQIAKAGQPLTLSFVNASFWITEPT